MKRYLLILFTVLAAAFSLSAADKGHASIKFDQTKIDLGQIHEAKGNATFTYNFTNTGTEPLIIVSVSNGGCGCTKPSFPKEPIAPGKKGKVSITFNPAGRRGDLNREVTVRTNGKPKTVKLRFSGVVIPSAR